MDHRVVDRLRELSLVRYTSRNVLRDHSELVGDQRRPVGPGPVPHHLLAWEGKALHELRAAGEALGESPAETAALTTQERAIAALAAEGHTNREIAATLSLSPRTVGYHLYKIFPKLGSPTGPS